MFCASLAIDNALTLFDSLANASFSLLIGSYNSEIESYSFKIGLNSVEIELNSFKIESCRLEMDLNNVEINLNNVEINLSSFKMDLNSIEIELSSVEMDLNSVEMDLNSFKIELNSFKIELNSFKIEFLIKVIIHNTEKTGFIPKEIAVALPQKASGNKNLTRQNQTREVNKMKILNNRQEAKLNMYDVVRTHCDANSTIINTNNAFKNSFGDFKILYGKISDAAQQASAVLTGIAVDKSGSKQNLSQTAAGLAGLIYAYAARIGNNTLKEAVNFSKSDLLILKDGEIVPRCQTIHDHGAANLAALGDYGVTAAKLEVLQNAINDYAQAVPKPRAAISDRKTTKANIRQHFKDADAILVNQMDKLIENFSAEYSDFVATYKSNRNIIDPQSKTTPDGNGDNNENPPA